MFLRLIFAISLLTASAAGASSNCPGEASLLQTHQHKGARAPGRLAEESTAELERNLGEGIRNLHLEPRNQEKIAQLERKVAELEARAKKAAPSTLINDAAADELQANANKAAPSALVKDEATETTTAKKQYETIPDELLEKMIVSTPWNCDLLPLGGWDPRSPTCGKSFNDTGLHPARLTEIGNSSHDHMNSMRMLFPIGALPCCSTMPFCGAPACAQAPKSVVSTVQAAENAPICTKNSGQDNFVYMSSAELWPAYHGWSGSYELDVMKHVDILGTVLRQDGRAAPVDLVVDIGANSGFITEKLTTRHFAKNYILVEAFKGMYQMFKERLGNPEFKQRWFAEQVPERAGAVVPNFQFLNYGVSYKSGGVLDLCVADDTMWGGPNNGKSCPVDKVALDQVIPSRLAPDFRSAFEDAENVYIKVDVEGYDQMALEGMAGVLKEERGTYSNGSPRHLVNFIQLELCVPCMEHVKSVENRTAYDVKTVADFLESLGFETFLMGPRYLPLSHGSWDDSYANFFQDPENSNAKTYRSFHDIYCPGPQCPQQPPINTFTADLFAMRSSHPKAMEIKLALGSCKESHDFSLTDDQYELPAKSVSA